MKIIKTALIAASFVVVAAAANAQGVEDLLTHIHGEPAAQTYSAPVAPRAGRDFAGGAWCFRAIRRAACASAVAAARRQSAARPDLRQLTLSWQKPAGFVPPAPLPGFRSARNSAKRDSVTARSSSASSPPAQPMNDRPTGQPATVPIGIDTCGRPAEAGDAGQPHHADAEAIQAPPPACRSSARCRARSAAPRPCRAVIDARGYARGRAACIVARASASAW